MYKKLPDVITSVLLHKSNNITELTQVSYKCNNILIKNTFILKTKLLTIEKYKYFITFFKNDDQNLFLMKNIFIVIKSHKLLEKTITNIVIVKESYLITFFIFGIYM